ncbi:Glutathione-regulated potassium-efflux system protein KefB [uncultured archaeon]|nr:Glutathione-regulated potassium-efflux system protein KefB [uncultured archaeon]
MADLMTQLGLIFFASVVFMLLALRLKLPPVVGLLLAGAIIGPNMLGLVSQSDYISIFAEIGAILLLFFVGIEFSISKIAKMGLRSFVVWVVKDAFIFVIVYEASLLLGLSDIVAIVLGSALAVSSTTFFIKFVGEKNITGSAEANLVFVVLIIEDLLAVFLLAIYSGMAGGNAGSMSSVLISVLKAMLALTVAYLVLQRVVGKVFEWLSGYRSDEVMLFMSMSFLILLSFFASFIGLAPSIGAFLAGSILSTVKGFRKTQDTLSKFGMLFSSFFFLSIGMLVSVQAMLQNIWAIAILFVLVSCGIFGSVFVSSYLLGYRSNAAVRSGLLVLTVGEFSLLIATQTKDLVAPFDIVSVTSALVFLTALSGGILIQQEKAVDTLVSRAVPQKIKDSAKRISLYLNEVFKDFEPGGPVYTTFIREGQTSLLSLVFFALIGVSGYLAYNIMNEVFPRYAGYVAMAAILLETMPVANIAYSLKKLMDKAALAFHKAMGQNLALDDLAMRDSGIALFMFALAFMIPLAVSLLKLPKVFGMFFLIPLFLSVLFVWNLAMTIRKIMFRKELYRYEKTRASFKAPYGHMIGEIRSINPQYKGHKHEKG